MIPTSDLIGRLRERGARLVGLQFPAGLKREAYGVATTLREAGFEPVISGDPCYGACDLAEGLFPHVDVLIHFGHTPVGESNRILYELVPRDIDIAILSNALSLLEQKRIGLVTTVQHAHLIDAMAAYLRARGIEVIIVPGTSRAPLRGQVLGCNFHAARNTGATEILFVGTGLFHPLGIQLATGARVVAVDPYTMEAQVVDGSRLLRKRFALLERAREARSIGIIISLKSGQQRWELARRLVTLDRKAVLVTMHEIIPDELLNLGMDCYVNTACPRLAYDDQSRFKAPVLTPAEFEILCGVRSWDQYQIDEIC